VIVPDEAAERGPARVPLAESNRPPLAPLRPPVGDEPEASTRPVFLDPPAPSHPLAPPPATYREPASYRESAYEQSILPDLRTGGLGPETRAPTRVQQGLTSPLLLGGLGAAVLVIVASILLIVGVF
jgi:hypothetical protein